MDLLTNRVKRSEIKRGDHIYTYRAVLTYSHHGIFVGENNVVHFTPVRELNSRTWTSSDSSFYKSPLTCSSYPVCGFRQPNSGVVRSCLDCFLGNGSLYRFEYGVSRVVFLAHGRGGTCSMAKSDPPEAVIHRALYLLLSGFGKYDVAQNNCEDFALYCKTGLRVVAKKNTDTGTSGQVFSVCSVISAPLVAILSSPLKFLVPCPGKATVTAAIYCMNRYATDIGIRTDVIKVPVEDLAVTHEEVDDDSEASEPDFVAMHSVSIPILDGTNFFDWSKQVQHYLGIWDLDLALRTEKPHAITDSSNAKEKATYNSWVRSNKLSIKFMQTNIANNIKSTLPKCDNAKEFFEVVEERFRSDDKCLTGTLMVTTMKFDDTRGMHEPIIGMTNLVTKLKAQGMNVDELFLVQFILKSFPLKFTWGIHEPIIGMTNLVTKLEAQGMNLDELFLVQFILNALPLQYESFQIHYNTIKDKWNEDELTSKHVQEEARLKKQGHHSVHLLNQGAKKIELPEVNGPPQVIEVHERRQNNVQCYFCRKFGHVQKNCHKRRAWFTKKRLPYHSDLRP